MTNKSDYGDKFFEGVEIETPYGFVSFEGIRKLPPKEIFEVVTENGYKIEGSEGHRFVVSGKEVVLRNLTLGDHIETIDGLSKITSIDFTRHEEVYDLLGVNNKDSSFWAGGILNHNCSFTGSTYTLIDGAILESMYPDDPAFIPEEGYHMWKRPEPGHLYAIGVDVAKGANTDYHVANIYDVTNHHKTGKYEQVAIFRRNDISVFDFQEKIIDIGKQWNEAVLIIENNNLGHAVVNEVYFEVGYENCFYDYDKGEYGINANKKTKPLALSYFKEDVETSRMKIHSDAMINELGFYEEVRTGVFQARSGREFHDDTVASGYWVSYLLRSRYWEDYLDWWIQNNDPDQQRLQSMLENDAVENDQSVADGFLKALGNPGMGDDYERDQFLRDLSM